MSAESNGVMDSASLPASAVSSPVVRPFYWSIRRELWENRSLYLGPLVVEGVFLFGFLLSTIWLPRRMAAALSYGPAKQHELISVPYSAAAFLMIMTSFFVGVFYCIDALHSERRDRSILFWKSLPVSDKTSVLAKASIPLVILPLFIIAIVITTHFVMLMASTTALAGRPRLVEALWAQVKFVQSSMAFVYGVIAIVLWHAPVYMWFLFVSAWAKRAVILWAVLPFVALAAVERIVFGTTFVIIMLGNRLVGWFKQAFVFAPRNSGRVVEPLAHLTPGEFLSTPGLWIGFFFAAAFLAAAVKLRRNQEPI